ncbi:MAG: hypothetical protein ABFC88_12910 [Thermoguttaceae bacterium]
MSDWAKWRLTYEGGDNFRDAYLEKFSTREDPTDFALRKGMTPIPRFAGTAIDDIRNSIYQRMRDIVRKSGSKSYQNAVNGLDLGVDRRGSTMNAFIGVKVLTELLVMGKVGIYVDAPVVKPDATVADGSQTPYLYCYQVEDILSWTCRKADDPSEFQSVLLRDTVMQYDEMYTLPTLQVQRYRHIWLDQNTGHVMLQFYDLDGNMVGADGLPGGGPVQLELTRIPFILLDIGRSLIKDVCQQQIALLNLGSSDVNYALRSNFPFYVEQKDGKAVGAHLKHAATEEGTASTGGQNSADTNVKVGATHGRTYDKGMNQPAFINPSSEPLNASLKLQDRLKQDIRELVSLAVSSLAVRASAESKAMDNQGLESGLSYIGLVLESAERLIASYWAAYERRTISARQVAMVKYPERYSLKSDADRIKEAGDLQKLMTAVPGRLVKRELAKSIVQVLLSGRLTVDELDAINQEIDGCNYTNSDPATIIQAVQAGICGVKTGGVAMGFDDNEHEAAQEDRIQRLKEIAQTQGVGQQIQGGGDPAARGLSDLSADPNAGRAEKAASRDNPLDTTPGSHVRGKGKLKPE